MLYSTSDVIVIVTSLFKRVVFNINMFNNGLEPCEEWTIWAEAYLARENQASSGGKAAWEKPALRPALKGGVVVL